MSNEKRKKSHSPSSEMIGSKKNAKNKKPRKPKVVGGMIEFPLGPLKEHLTCSLCEGFLRDAYTISECLHSFCKSCLFCEYAKGCTKCPECSVNLGPDPYPVTIYDRTLQELVDSILPQLKANDEKEERIFYNTHGIKPKQEFAENIMKQEGSNINGVVTNSNDTVSQTNVKKKSKKMAEGITIADDELDFELQPQSEGKQKILPPLKKTILRASGKLKIFQLKKFIISQLNLASSLHPEMEVRCNGDPVGDELSLTFIKRTRCLTNEDLFLTYGLMDTDACMQSSL